MTYDWIVIGGGLAGSAAGYELAQAGYSVLLLEKDALPRNATRYSYGGIAYWSGDTALTRQLCAEGIELHRHLPDELGSATHFREVDLLLTINLGREAEAIASYAQCVIPPQLISADEACSLEPLLNREAIAGALRVSHGLVDPELMVNAYTQAMVRLKGDIRTATVQELIRQGDRISGVKTDAGSIAAANVLVAAGGMSRSLLHTVGLTLPCYFTHAELVELAPSGCHLRTIVMPAEQQRFSLEATVGCPEQAGRWQQPGQELVPAAMDAGAVELLDGRIRIGQISRALTDPQAQVDPTASESRIRAEVGRVLPALEPLPGQWASCLVAFGGDRLPLVGPVPGLEGLHLFSGFSSPFALLPPVARRFARHLTGQPDDILPALSPARFSQLAR